MYHHLMIFCSHFGAKMTVNRMHHTCHCQNAMSYERSSAVNDKVRDENVLKLASRCELCNRLTANKKRLLSNRNGKKQDQSNIKLTG